MLIPTAPPSEDALIRDLTIVRDEGLPRLRHLSLEALASAARLVTLDEASTDHVVIETLLRRATTRLGGGHYGQAAVALLGLDAGTRGLNSRARREIAAEAFERTYETFRKNYEAQVFEQVVTQILVLCSEQHTRQSHSASERAESPETSAMRQVWMDRFAAYYRIWLPVNGLGGDLTGQRATLLESSEIWDRRFGTQSQEDQGYSRDEQAEGYATFALYHYARFEWELRQFEAQFGGQWLLSDAEAEQGLSDAVYQIRWYAPWNERDQSFLRMIVANTAGHELHAFIELIRSDELARITEQEWHEWASTCNCSWPPGMTESEYFPTSQSHATISTACDVHNLVRACATYLEIVDREWHRVADWYHLPRQRWGVNAERLYEDRLDKRRC